MQFLHVVVGSLYSYAIDRHQLLALADSGDKCVALTSKDLRVADHVSPNFPGYLALGETVVLLLSLGFFTDPLRP